MAVTYSKQMFIERVKKHLANGFPHANFPITDNEIMLYIDSAIPFVMKGQMYENAKVTGIFEVPDAYQVTYNIGSVTVNNITKEWYATLPQTPLELPTGYNIISTYFYDTVSFLTSTPAIPRTLKRKNFRYLLPTPTCVYYRCEGNTILYESSNGNSFFNLEAYVVMPISRTSDKTTVMSLPDGAIEPIFQKVVATILQRYQIPQDIVKDDLPAGNKSS